MANRLKTPFSNVFIKLILRTIYFVLFVVALRGPSFGEMEQSEVKLVGKDIFICVDLSNSMNAYDVAPTRLEKVKYEMKNIVEAFRSDRIGLIMFSNEAYIQCPLTFDGNALKLFIKSLNTGLVPNAGTNFGPPLKMALNKLENNESNLTQQSSKIILLISDGEDFGEEKKDLTDELNEKDIRLFTLGVGTLEGSKIQTRRGFKKNKSGKDVITKLNSNTLKELAVHSGGKYFEIGKTRNDVSRLISAINNIEGELRDSQQIDTKSNKYFYFLAAALFLMALDILTGLTIIRI